LPLNAIWQHWLGKVFAQMLQVRADHACAVFLCGRRNTCNGDQVATSVFISYKCIGC
jgi:hypothetical protein